MQMSAQWGRSIIAIEKFMLNHEKIYNEHTCQQIWQQTWHSPCLSLIDCFRKFPTAYSIGLIKLWSEWVNRYRISYWVPISAHCSQTLCVRVEGKCIHSTRTTCIKSLYCSRYMLLIHIHIKVKSSTNSCHRKVTIRKQTERVQALKARGRVMSSGGVKWCASEISGRIWHAACVQTPGSHRHGAHAAALLPHSPYETGFPSSLTTLAGTICLPHSLAYHSKRHCM